jgi:hypothetical protein
MSKVVAGTFKAIAWRALGLALCLSLATSASAQQELLEQRWLLSETEHFTILSQASARQTRNFAEQIESWRQVAAYVVQGDSPFPPASVPNYVYLFADQDSFRHFSSANQAAFFYPTPRANFMALMVNDELSVEEGLHHYVHFLMRNFLDLRLPRWYEEGMAGYLSRMQVNGSRAQWPRYSANDNQMLAQLSETLAVGRLLFQDEALASPRVIQIANIKSESLLHYLLHGHEEEAFPDRRPQLESYLQLLLEGRNHRFAFDQSFDITSAQLDEEFHTYLLTSGRPRIRLEYPELGDHSGHESERLAQDRLAILLGELALNAGRPENSQLFFEYAIESGTGIARSHSGLGDALRYQELDASDQTIAGLFQEALDLAPEEPGILLDFGEYWEAELEDCAKTYPANERVRIIGDIKQHFLKALELSRDSPEANLAMAQIYLFPEQDWRDGRDYQRKAFELLPADTFIMEQAAKYAVAADDYEGAEGLIKELAQPIHYFGEPGYVTDLRERLLRKRRNENYDVCAE